MRIETFEQLINLVRADSFVLRNRQLLGAATIIVLQNLEHAQRVIGKFIDDYNRKWILHQLGFLSPLEYKNKSKSA